MIMSLAPDTVETYADIQQNIETLESMMESHRRDIRHALKDLDNDRFHAARMEADIVAKKLQDFRDDLERCERRLSREWKSSKPKPLVSHPIDD